MVKFVKMIQAEYSKIYEGGHACVVVAIDELALVAETKEHMDNIISYTTEALSTLEHTDFKFICSVTTAYLIKKLRYPAGRNITYVPLPLLTFVQSKQALAMVHPRFKGDENMTTIIDRLLLFAKGHPRSLSVIARNLLSATGSDIRTIFNKCAVDVVAMFKPLQGSTLPLLIDALRGFRVPSTKTYSDDTIGKLIQQGILLPSAFNDHVSLIVPPFYMLKFADQVIAGKFLTDMPGLMPTCRILKCLFELPSALYAALEHRCLLMTILTMLLTKRDQRVSVLDLFVRDSGLVYTSGKFNYLPLVSGFSGIDDTAQLSGLNFSTTDYTISTRFESITREQFKERFPTGMLTGAMMQAGQLAVDSMIFDCRNPEEPYAIFFKNKYSHASTTDASVSPLDLLDEYRLFQENIVPKLIGMLFVFTCRQPTYLISFRSHGR